MPVTVAINGFGRIGRNILRALIESKRQDIRVVAINDLAPIATMAHLLRYDSVHGHFPYPIDMNDTTLRVQGTDISVSALRDPADLAWDGVDIALECTGLFTSRDKAAAHLKNGSKQVLVSAPASGADKTIVYGINHTTLSAKDTIVSNASCTTNCLSPIVYALHKTIGVASGMMTTIHSYTGDQPVLDAIHRDLYRARAAALSMVPTSTGAARAIGLVIPELAGKLDGVSVRVPTPNVSAVDLTFCAARATSVEEINTIMTQAAAEPHMAGILAVTDEKLVSSDLNHNSHSAIFTSDQTKVINGTLGRVFAWYDNEWGFSNRMLDTAVYMKNAI